MAIKRTYRTTGVSTDGTSVLAATPKKKSKSKKLWTALGIGALALGGLSAYGGWGSTGGGGFLQSLGAGANKIKTTIGGIGSSIFGEAATKTSVTGFVPGPHDGGVMGTGTSVAQSGKSGVLKGFFSGLSNMSSGTASILGSALQVGGNLLDKKDEDMLAFNIAQHEDLMDYRYEALDVEAAAAQAALEKENRGLAQEGMFMGHGNPVTASAEGVPSLGAGYTPETPITHPEFHPAGGLISQGQIA